MGALLTISILTAPYSRAERAGTPEMEHASIGWSDATDLPPWPHSVFGCCILVVEKPPLFDSLVPVDRSAVLVRRSEAPTGFVKSGNGALYEKERSHCIGSISRMTK